MARTTEAIGGVECVTERRWNPRDHSSVIDVYEIDGETPIILGARSIGDVTMALSERLRGRACSTEHRPAIPHPVEAFKVYDLSSDAGRAELAADFDCRPSPEYLAAVAAFADGV